MSRRLTHLDLSIKHTYITLKVQIEDTNVEKQKMLTEPMKQVIYYLCLRENTKSQEDQRRERERHRVQR